MSFFISDALAETAPMAPQPGGGMQTLVMVVIFAVIFYLMIWRPQAKRQKEQKQMMEALAKGDEIVTTGGLMGKVTKVADDYLQVSLADNVEVKLQKQAVAAVLPKGTLKQG